MRAFWAGVVVPPRQCQVSEARQTGVPTRHVHRDLAPVASRRSCSAACRLEQPAGGRSGPHTRPCPAKGGPRASTGTAAEQPPAHGQAPWRSGQGRTFHQLVVVVLQRGALGGGHRSKRAAAPGGRAQLRTDCARGENTRVRVAVHVHAVNTRPRVPGPDSSAVEAPGEGYYCRNNAALFSSACGRKQPGSTRRATRMYDSRRM